MKFKIICTRHNDLIDSVVDSFGPEVAIAALVRDTSTGVMWVNLDSSVFLCPSEGDCRGDWQIEMVMED